MPDAITGIFTDEILRRLRKAAVNSRLAEFRLQILSPHASKYLANSPLHDQPFYEQKRERWSQWIATALSFGMFEEAHGAELKSRLTGIDDDGFRSALAECMTCWAFSTQPGSSVLPRPSGQGARVLEFAIQTSYGEVGLEVKSPRLRGSLPLGPAEDQATSVLNNYSVAVAMRAALRSANRQFARTRRNILVIALPAIGEPTCITPERWLASLIRAFYGERRVITAAPGGPESELVAEGDFLKRPGGVPRFTRISAVVGLGEFGSRLELQAVLHNPCSERPVDPSIFGDWMQLVPDNGEIHCFGTGNRNSYSLGDGLL
jgi:hypothetical protein